ncbi:MAG TPA: SH3 domain-containing protein [Opitutaceae bacterium]|nr:SH3 domain-containing protein [Opitutaceae bacterium]
MKVNQLLLAAALAAASLRAAPLTETTAVQAHPSADAPALAILKAGTEPVPAAGVTAPPGWLAVELPGPYQAYVMNKDFLKSLDVRIGAPIRIAPKSDAPVLTMAEKTDSIEITGLFGRWTQIKLTKKIVGYIQLASAAPAPPPPVPAPDVTPAPVAAPVALDNNVPGHEVSTSPATLPRLLEGTVVSTRHAFTPRRPYDYQLNDISGSRLAYIDASHLLITVQMDNYIGQKVDLYGTVKQINGGNDLVIAVESLQLK